MNHWLQLNSLVTIIVSVTTLVLVVVKYDISTDTLQPTTEVVSIMTVLSDDINDILVLSADIDTVVVVLDGETTGQIEESPLSRSCI